MCQWFFWRFCFGTDLTQMFERFDRNKDGCISLSDFMEVLFFSLEMVNVNCFFYTMALNAGNA